MEKKQRANRTAETTERLPNDTALSGVFGQVIGGGTAVIRDKKPGFTASNAKKRASDKAIVTDPLGSWTGVPADPYDMPIQDADDL